MFSRNFARTLVLVLAASAFQPNWAHAANDSANFISDLGARAITVLSSQAPQSEREKQFRAIFDAGFDVPAIARFTLGRYWLTASEAQRTEYTALFSTYMVHVYTVRFNEFVGLKFMVTGSRPEGDASSLVSSRMGNTQPVAIDWRVATKGGDFKITDLVVEGISMSVTQRQEFGAVIQRGGGDVESLLKLLRQRTTQS
jgi:phospholipid transport system substrate-binding protein